MEKIQSDAEITFGAKEKKTGRDGASSLIRNVFNLVLSHIVWED